MFNISNEFSHQESLRITSLESDKAVEVHLEVRQFGFESLESELRRK